MVESWPAAPVVANRGGEPVVLVAAGTTLRTLAADGTVRASWTLPGIVAADPALADLDGDGSDEVILPVSTPNALVALDSSGVAPVGSGWPVSLASAPQGAPVAGHLRGDGRPGLVMMTPGRARRPHRQRPGDRRLPQAGRRGRRADAGRAWRATGRRASPRARARTR